jgi:hypothetical protein
MFFIKLAFIILCCNLNYSLANNSTYINNISQNGIVPSNPSTPPNPKTYGDQYRPCNDGTIDTHFHISTQQGGSLSKLGPNWTANNATCTPSDSNFLQPKIAAQHTFRQLIPYISWPPSWPFYGELIIHETITLSALGECGIYFETGFARGCARFYSYPKAKCNRPSVSDSDPPPPNPDSYDWCHNTYVCVFSDPIDPWGDIDPFNMPLPHRTHISNSNIFSGNANSMANLPYIGSVIGPAYKGEAMLESLIFNVLFSRLKPIFQFLGMQNFNELVLSNAGCIAVPLAPFPPDYTTFFPIEAPSLQTVPICQLYYSGKIRKQQNPTSTNMCEYGHLSTASANNIFGNIFYSTFTKPAIRAYYNLPMSVVNGKINSSEVNFCSSSITTNCVQPLNYDQCNVPAANSSFFNQNKGVFLLTSYVPPSNNSTNNLNNLPTNEAYSHTSIKSNPNSDFLLRFYNGSGKSQTVSNASVYDAITYYEKHSEKPISNDSFTITSPFSEKVNNYTFQYKETLNNQFCILDSKNNSIGCIKRPPMPMPLIVGYGKYQNKVRPQTNQTTTEYDIFTNNNASGIIFKSDHLEIIGPQDSADNINNATFSTTDFPANISECNSMTNNMGLYVAIGDDKPSVQDGCISIDFSKPNLISFLIPSNQSNSSKYPDPLIINGTKFSLYPTDQYNTSAAFLSISSKNTDIPTLLGNYVDETGTIFDLLDPDNHTCVQNIKTVLQNYALYGTTPLDIFCSIKEKNGKTVKKSFYYVGGLEYVSNYYIRGATKLCLAGYKTNDNVVASNLSHSSGPALITTNSTNLKNGLDLLNFWSSQPNLSQYTGDSSNVLTCKYDKRNNSNVAQRQNQFHCPANSKNPPFTSKCIYTPNKLNQSFDMLNMASPYLPDRVIPPFPSSVQNITKNNQYIDSIATQVTDTSHYPLPSISDNSITKLTFYTRQKTPQELGVCIDIPAPQCIVSTLATSGDAWNIGNYDIGEKVPGTHYSSNPPNKTSTITGICAGDPNNAGSYIIQKLNI